MRNRAERLGCKKNAQYKDTYKVVADKGEGRFRNCENFADILNGWAPIHLW